MKKHDRKLTLPYIFSGWRLALVAVGMVWLVAGSLVTFATTDKVATPLSVEGMPLGDDYPYLSPLDLTMSPDGDIAYVAHHTGMRVEAIDMTSGEALWGAALNAAPSGLVLDPEQSLLYVTYGLNQGRIAALHATSGEFVFSMSAGHTPVAPALSPDGATLYVSNRFNNEIVAYDLESHMVTKRSEVYREPIALALTPDGATLVAAQHLPAQAANSRHVAAQVDLMDAASLEIAASVVLPSGSTGVRNVAIGPEGRYAYVTHTLGRFHLPTTQLERGWMNTSALSIIDLEKQELLTAVLLDDVDQGAANPWGVVCTPDGRHLVVTHSGTHEISVIDRAAMHAKIDRVAAGERVSEVSVSLEAIPNDLGFLVGLRNRIKLPGNGPRGLALAGETAVIAEYFTDSLALVELGEAATPKITQMALSDIEELSEVRQGEIAFNDASLCFQQWQSCASCHPDVRADALNWDLLNDGIGNPKNTRSLLYSHQTPPVMISGIRPEAEVAVRAGFRFIQFAEVHEDVASSVDAYLSTLQDVPSPQLEGGALSPAAVRGKAVFEQAGCMYCHSGPHYTDGKLYDVGIGPDELGIEKFVTPPLSEVWRTAPYLYDGRAESILEIFTEHNPDDKHGETSMLSEEELHDLVAYILSL